MGGLPGGKYTIIRMIGMVLNLVSLIIVLVFVGLAIDRTSGQSMVMIIAPILEVVGFILLLKLELVIGIVGLLKKKQIQFEFDDEKRPLYLGIILGGSIGLQIILGWLVSGLDLVWLFYIPIMIAAFALTMVWQYTLTIYKNEKQRFWISFIAFEVLWVIFGIMSILYLLVLVPALIVLIAVFMITFAEKQLIAKNLMHFI